MRTFRHKGLILLYGLTFSITSELIEVVSCQPYYLYHHHETLPYPQPEPPPFVFPGGGRSMGASAPVSFQGCQGVCMHRDQCRKLGGFVSSECTPSYFGSTASCCQFNKSCNNVTTAFDTKFESPGYPAPAVGALVCKFEILIQPGVCGVRLKFHDFNTTAPLDRGLCNIDQFLIMNSLEGPAFPRCGELTGYTTIVPVDSRHKLPLVLLSIIQSSSELYKWSVVVNQIRCDHVHGVTDYPGCGQILMDNDSEKLPPLEEDSTAVSVITEVPNDVENIIPEQVFYEADIRNVVDTAFLVAYLKRAYEALANSTLGHNSTLCKNRHDEIDNEKLVKDNSEFRSRAESEFVDDLGRIIRGSEALVNEFPWQVSLQDFRGHVCGGAIISPRAVLTAAHCFLGIAPVPLRSIRLYVGDLNLNVTTESKEELVAVETVVFHSHFDPYYLSSDIALIVLKESLVFRAAVQPICLPERGNSYVGKKATISGWGATSYPNGRLATTLQRTTNIVIENSECRKKLNIDYLYRTMLCASTPNCTGTCYGDSGGPLTVETAKGQHVLVGLVSFGIGGCALMPYWPDVYTRVSEFLDWLSYALFEYH